jgi:hypothetical protein
MWIVAEANCIIRVLSPASSCCHRSKPTAAVNSSKSAYTRPAKAMAVDEISPHLDTGLPTWSLRSVAIPTRGTIFFLAFLIRRWMDVAGDLAVAPQNLVTPNEWLGDATRRARDKQISAVFAALLKMISPF